MSAGFNELKRKCLMLADAAPAKSGILAYAKEAEESGHSESDAILTHIVAAGSKHLEHAVIKAIASCRETAGAVSNWLAIDYAGKQFEHLTSKELDEYVKLLRKQEKAAKAYDTAKQAYEDFTDEVLTDADWLVREAEYRMAARR